jgi:hypothetical protein
MGRSPKKCPAAERMNDGWYFVGVIIVVRLQVFVKKRCVGADSDVSEEAEAFTA